MPVGEQGAGINELFALNICGRFGGLVFRAPAYTNPGLTALWIGVSAYTGMFASGERC